MRALIPVVILLFGCSHSAPKGAAGPHGGGGGDGGDLASGGGDGGAKNAPDPEPYAVRRLELSDAPPLAVRRFARRATEAEVAPGGNVIAVIAVGPGGELRLGKKQRRLPRQTILEGAYAPGAELFGFAAEGDKVSVLSTQSGKVVGSVEGQEPLRWIDERTLGFRRGCQGFRVVAGESAAPLGPAAGVCGEVLVADYRRGHWVVATQDKLEPNGLWAYSQIAAVDLSSGKVAWRATDLARAPFILPRASSDLSRVCFADAKLALRCAKRDVVETVWPGGVDLPVVFSDDGHRLLFAFKASGGGYEIGVADFAAHEVMRFPRGAYRDWAFLPGGHRVVGHGGPGPAVVIDLDEGWKRRVGKRGEWQGVSTIPGSQDALIVGRESGSSRDLYWAEIR